MVCSLIFLMVILFRYTTSGSEGLTNDISINDFHKREMNSQPIFVSVDTTLKSVEWVKCFYLFGVQIESRGVLQVLKRLLLFMKL